MNLEVMGVSKKHEKYYICLENDEKIRVNKEEFQKMKRRLAGKGKHYINISKESAGDDSNRR